MTETVRGQLLAQAVVEFAKSGQYLDADLSEPVSVHDVPAALEKVGEVKSALESEVQDLSRQVAPEVDIWIKQAGHLQCDIEASRRKGYRIARDAEHGESIKNAVRDAADHSRLLDVEIDYNALLLDSLQRIRDIKKNIDASEAALRNKSVTGAIRSSVRALRTIHNTVGFQRVRAYSLLQNRALKVQDSIRLELNNSWAQVVQIDPINKSIMFKTAETEGDLASLGVIVKAFVQLEMVDDKVTEFNDELEATLFEPVLSRGSGAWEAMMEDGGRIRLLKLENEAANVSGLLNSLATIIHFLDDHLAVFGHNFGKALLPGIASRVRESWLDATLPVSITETATLDETLNGVRAFVDDMRSIGWTGTELMTEWIADCAKLWLAKRRENDLGMLRHHISRGLVKKNVIRRQEEQVIEVQQESAIANSNDWDAAWTDGDTEIKDAVVNDPDLDTDAWGWEDDDLPSTDDSDAKPEKKSRNQAIENPISTTTSHKVLVKWEYQVSCMPEAALLIIKDAIENGLYLTKPENTRSPIAPAAIGLFSLTTPCLAMYRAISPYYYELAEGGNMFLYNDAMWLAEQLEALAKQWVERTDLTPRAQGKVRLDSEVATMKRFADRGYNKELSAHRTILKDFMRGDHCFLTEEGIDISDDEPMIDSVVAHVEAISLVWESILARTTWAQAVGSLLSAVAKKIVMDVLDLTTLEADASYNIAKLIAQVATLENLYTKKNDKSLSEDGLIPLSAIEYADGWLKMQYLSEVLQSNLEAVKYLWFEGELSLFYDSEEVADLITMSFAEGQRREEAIRGIKQNPRPRVSN